MPHKPKMIEINCEWCDKPNKTKGGYQLMERIEVMTPSGPGIIWGIGPGKVLVEMDYSYLVEFEPEQVERIEREGES